MERRKFIRNLTIGTSVVALPIGVSAKNTISNPTKKVRFGIITDVHNDVMHDGEYRLRSFLNAAKNSAPTAPSTTLWSQERVTSIIVLISSLSLITTGRFELAPTAIMQPCGGLIIALKFLIPYIPKLEILKPPP